MKILSLDLSTKSSGWAIFDNGLLMKSGCITCTSLDLIKRIKKMTAEIRDIINENGPIDKIIAEEVRPEGTGYGVGNQKTHKALMYLQAAITFMLYDDFNKKEMELIYPSSWRASIGIKTGRGIKRTSLKEKDIQFVKENYNLDVNDDEADAICIGYSCSHDEETDINWE